MTRKRADVVLVERGFFASRARAQEAIAAGLVTVNGTPVRKASDAVPEEAVDHRRAAAPLRVPRRRQARSRPRRLPDRPEGPDLPRHRRLHGRLHRGAAHARRGPCLCGRCRARPAPPDHRRRCTRDQSRRHRRPRPERHARSPSRSDLLVVGRELHLAQARPACRRRPAEAARGPRRSGEAAIRGRARPREEGHRARRGRASRRVRGHDGLRRLARLHASSGSSPRPSRAGTATANFLLGARRG